MTAVAGSGPLYGREPMIAAERACGRLRAVLEAYAPTVPGLFLYFPSRTQVSSALDEVVGVARELANEPLPATRGRGASA